MTNELKEILSSEGVEERIEFEMIFRTTLTGGGKLHNYTIRDGKIDSIDIHNTRQEAKISLGKFMFLTGGMIFDPKGTVDHILEIMKAGRK